MTETNTARIELRDEELLIVRIKDRAYQSLADTRENLATAIAEGQPRRRPLLVDIRTAQPLEAEVHFYSGQVLIEPRVRMRSSSGAPWPMRPRS
jgi:hypothetical protein